MSGERTEADIRYDIDHTGTRTLYNRDPLGYTRDFAAERLQLDASALLDRIAALTVRAEQAEADVQRLRVLLNGSDAWFGAWECGCSDTERSPKGIPEYCPLHGRRLISNMAGSTKVQLTHSGVSGYGFKAGPVSGEGSGQLPAGHGEET